MLGASARCGAKLCLPVQCFGAKHADTSITPNCSASGRRQARSGHSTPTSPAYTWRPSAADTTSIGRSSAAKRSCRDCQRLRTSWPMSGPTYAGSSGGAVLAGYEPSGQSARPMPTRCFGWRQAPWHPGSAPDRARSVRCAARSNQRGPTSDCCRRRGQVHPVGVRIQRRAAAERRFVRSLPRAP